MSLIKRPRFWIIALALAAGLYLVRELPTHPARAATTYYVSTTGNTTTNTGAIGSPFDLNGAFACSGTASVIGPGDTVRIRGSAASGGGTTYTPSARIMPKCVGNAANHITFTNYPGELVKIDGVSIGTALPIFYFYANTANATNPAVAGVTGNPTSGYAAYMDVIGLAGGTAGVGLELLNSVNPKPGGGSFTQYGVLMKGGRNLRWLNTYIHDLGFGISIQSADTSTTGTAGGSCFDCEAAGNVIQYNGKAGGGLDGHGLYSQSNLGGTNFQNYLDNIVHHNAGMGFHGFPHATDIQYTAVKLAWSAFYGNAQGIFGGGSGSHDVLFGGDVPAASGNILNDYVFSPDTRTGSQIDIGQYADNPVDGVTMQGLKVVGLASFHQTSLPGSNTFNGNVYSNATDPRYSTGGGPYNTTTIKATFPTNAFYGAGNQPDYADAHPTSYTAGRCNIYILNKTALASSVNVNLSSCFAAGDVLEIRSASNFSVVAQTSNYFGGVLPITMTGLTMAAPLGGEATPATYGSPAQFAAFVAIKTGVISGTPTNTPTITPTPTPTPVVNGSINLAGGAHLAMSPAGGVLPADQPLTVMFWARFKNYSLTDGVLFSRTAAGGNRSTVYLKSSDGRTLRLWDGTDGVDGSVLTSNTWYHFAYTRTGTTQKVYVNAVLDITGGTSPAATLAGDAFWLGNDLFGDKLDADFAGWKAWTRALSAGEIATEKAFIAPQSATNLHSWTPFDTISDLLDQSGNANHWTLVAAPGTAQNATIPPYDSLGPTPTNTPTPTRTFTPTITFTPTQTSTPTATPTPAAGITIRNCSTTSFSTATGTSIVVNKPTGTVNDDLMVAVSNTMSFTTPATLSGWTQRLAGSNGRQSLYIFTKKAAGEGASYTWTLSGADDGEMAICSWSGVDTTTPIDAAASSTNGTTTLTPAAPSITTATDNAMLVAFFGVGAPLSTFTPPGGMSERADFNSAGNVYNSALEVTEELKPSAGATGTRTTTYGGASVQVSIAAMLALRSAVVPTPTPTPTSTVTPTFSPTPTRTTTPTPTPTGPPLPNFNGFPFQGWEGKANLIGAPVTVNLNAVASTVIFTVPRNVPGFVMTRVFLYQFSDVATSTVVTVGSVGGLGTATDFVGSTTLTGATAFQKVIPITMPAGGAAYYLPSQKIILSVTTPAGAAASCKALVFGYYL